MILSLYMIYQNILMVMYQQTKHGTVLSVKTGLTIYQFTISDPVLNHVAFHVSGNSS